MPTPAPFFSVLIATHLRSALLRRSLNSLRAQTFQDFEIIVVADAWDADSAVAAVDLLRPCDRFLKRSGAPGPALSRNAALDMACGEWVVFLDDDDTFLPSHLQTVHVEACDPAAQLLFSDCAVIIEDRSLPGMPALSQQQLSLIGNNTDALWVKNFIPNHALAYRRSLLGEDCRFDAHLASQEDWDFLLSALSRALPQPFAGGGAVMHKDYVNPGTRRGMQENSNNSTVVLDFLHSYRRWPAPTEALKLQRQALLKGVGLDLPLAWF